MAAPIFNLQLTRSTESAQWRQPPAAKGPDLTLFINRFTDSQPDREERSAVCAAGLFTLGMSLISANIDFHMNRRQIFVGRTRPGSMHISSPGDEIRVVKTGATDLYYMFVPVPLVAEVLADTQPSAIISGVELVQRNDFDPDTRILRLFRALRTASQQPTKWSQLHAEGLSIAIIAALLHQHSNLSFPSGSTDRHGLDVWQVQRVHDYIFENMGQPLMLQDLASVVGLSRMHFARRFLQATGLRPHDYVLRLRIERAQHLLVRTSMPIIDIALHIGFETHSHFAAVFKRFTGHSPTQWRSSR